MKKTIEQFISDAYKVHGDRYNYSKVNYNGAKVKICITCPDHGEFLQQPSNHLSGNGCPKCWKAKKNIKYFIEKANKVHNFIYDYSKSIYKNSKTKLIIICKKHGEFLKQPSSHLSGKGCQKCGREHSIKIRSRTKSKFIEQAKSIHNDKYDYSLANSTTNNSKIKIICPIHGEFYQLISNHLSGNGCKKCANRSLSIFKQEDLNIFIKKATVIHNNTYDYSESKYINSSSKLKIICKKHGSFESTPNNHLNGKGCKQCAYTVISKKNTQSSNEFIAKAINIHGDTYIYDKVEYISNVTKILIVCKVHGEFKQSPYVHLSGSGCSKCSRNISKKETLWLDSLNIKEKYRQISLNGISKKIKVDGYDPITNTIYEFYGDYWHGNPKIFKSDEINPSIKKTFGELFIKTMEREKLLIINGYNVKHIWESDWDNAHILG